MQWNNPFWHIRAKKSLGQNFLIDEDALETIAYASEISEKNIIEVGPGYGALTDFLLPQNPKNLTLVELDNDMISILEKRKQTDWNHFPSDFSLHNQDILQFSPSFENYNVIANIPYYITSPILFHFLYPFLENKNFCPPNEMVILMQKEVWEKIIGWKPKKPKFSYLSLAMYEACEKIDTVCLVPASSFQPAPKVDSIVLRFVIKKNRDSQNEKKLLALWSASFSQPRKTLVSNLSSQYSSEKIRDILEKFHYPATVRAEAIAKEDWKNILQLLQ